jgi:type II secretory pathway component HofQ
MIESRYIIKIILCFTMIAVCPPNAGAQSQQVDTEQTKTVDIGRDDPFAKLVTNKTMPVLPAVSVTAGVRRDVPELFVQTIMLRFLEAKSLKQAIDGMSSEFGTIAINEKNNSLIVCDTKEYLAKIIAGIKKADKTPQQIMIEVVILDVQLNDDTEIGINWDLLSGKRYDVGYRQNFTANRLGSTQENAMTIGDASAFNTTGLGGSFSVISGTVRNVVHLIQQKREVEILASPRVMMVSGESASIQAV